MWWRRKKQKRQASYGGYTDYRLTGSGGDRGRDVVAIAGQAYITPDTIRTAPLTRSVLGQVGRDLILRGESVWWIQVEAGAIRLYRCASHTVSGGIAPDTWQYTTLQVSGATATHSVQAHGDEVLHFRFSVADEAAADGVSPLQRANISSDLYGSLATALNDEIKHAARGYVLPVPAVDTTEDSSGDVTADTRAQLRSDLARLSGHTTVVETMSQAWGEGRAAAPSSDCRQQRLGAALCQMAR